MNSHSLPDFRLILVILLVLCRAPALAQAYQETEETVSVRSNLRPEEVMLMYTLSDSLVEVYALAVDSTILAKQSLNILFWESLESYRRKLRSADPNEFSILGQVLYLYLVKPVEEFLAGKERLIIIPGRQLTGVPFETLVVPDNNPPPYNICNIHYLIRDYEIVYQCSPRNWLDGEVAEHPDGSASEGKQPLAFIGFSPEFTGYPGLSPLPASVSEVREIGSLFSRKGLPKQVISGPGSNEERFRAVAGNARIIHLATHYLHDTEEAGKEGFLFWGYDPSGKRREEGILSAEEIGKLNIRADLIVLSACSSGVPLPGGNDSLNTVPCIFYTTGAKNVMATLWNVNDRLTSDFMVGFYRNLLSGNSCAQALREVKLQMISSPGTALPTIWAPYVLTGN